MENKASYTEFYTHKKFGRLAIRRISHNIGSYYEVRYTINDKSPFTTVHHKLIEESADREGLEDREDT